MGAIAQPQPQQARPQPQPQTNAFGALFGAPGVQAAPMGAMMGGAPAPMMGGMPVANPNYGGMAFLNPMVQMGGYGSGFGGGYRMW